MTGCVRASRSHEAGRATMPTLLPSPPPAEISPVLPRSMPGARGDATASAWFSRHVLPHRAGLVHWLRRRFPALDAEDVAQEASLSILREYDRAAIRHPRACFYTIALRRACKLMRRYRAGRIKDVAWAMATSGADTCPDAATRIDERQRIAELHRAIAQLPPRCQAVMRLVGLEQRRRSDVAATMGLAVKTVNTQYGRGLRHCARLLPRE